MFGVFIVFAVILFLILGIGLIFLRFSDVFLVFSIVAFMVLVVFALMPVVVKRRQRPGIAGMKGMKSMLDLVYDKQIFDMDDIFVDQDWGKEMIKNMLYDKIVFAYADPQTIREMFGKGKDFLDVDELIIKGPKQLTKREYIYSLTNQFRTILRDLKIDMNDVEDGMLFALLLSGKVIGNKREFREELENLYATGEILNYAANKLNAHEINEITTKKQKYYQKLEKSFKKKYIKVLKRKRNKHLLFSMVQVETGRSNETYPLTWFYRTLHEKLVTIFEKPWSEQEKYKQAYVVLYFFVSKFVRKKVAISEKQEKNIREVEDLLLFPPMRRITEGKRVFFEAILSARRDVSQKSPLFSLLPLLPSPETDDLFRYYEFFESLGEIGVEQIKTLMNHYKNIVGYISRNRESVLVYDLIYGVIDIIYTPLFMLKTFPEITQVKRNWSENSPWKISFDEKDFRNKLGIRRVHMSDAVRDKLSVIIIACSIFSMTLRELESFMKALLVISFYTNARYSNPLEFIKSKSFFSGFFHRELYKKFYNDDTRFRIGVLVPVVISALKKAARFISYVKSEMVNKKKKRIEYLESKTTRTKTSKALRSVTAKVAVLQGKIRRLEESVKKQEETKQTLIEKLTEIVPGLKSKEQISVPDFANKINGNYEFDFLDISFIVDCYRYLLEMMMRTGKGFNEGIDGKYLLNKQIFVKELENALV